MFAGSKLIANVPETRFVVTGLRAGNTACYSVRAVDAAGQRSPRTAPACCTTPDTTPPSTPTEPTATVQLQGQVLVRWAASTDDVGVVRYEVSRAGGPVSSVTGTSLADSGLATLKEYCYVIRAVDAAGNRSGPSTPACATIPDTRPPSVPASVAAKARDEHAIALTWAASQDDVGVVRYEVTQSAPAGAGTPLATASTTALLSGFAPATTSCFTVRACDAAGNCSPGSAAACATTPDLTPPSRPTAVAKATSDERIEVRWGESTDNVGVAAYEIFRGDKVVGRTGPAALVLADSGLRPTVEYCYRVEAIDAAGNRSSGSPVVCARPPDLKPPTTPETPAAVPVSATQVFVAWDPSKDDVGVAGYEVLRDGVVVADVKTTRARERGLRAERQYCYTVRAYDQAGNRSPGAGPFCAFTAKPTDLAAPSDLRVRRLSATNVLLQWDPSDQAGVTYVISADGMKIGRTSASTFTPSGSLGAKPNCYRVAAVDGGGRESAMSNEICARALEPVSQR